MRIYLFLLLLCACALSHTTRAEDTPVVLVHGDSLSAGYGIEVSEGWVALLADKLKQRPHSWRVINSSVSGETTSGGKTRLPELLSTHQPDLVIIELGGNDGLQGQPLPLIKTNLTEMINAARAARAQVVLVGIEIPPNYGARYARGFAQLFPTVAAESNTPLVPFLLDKVAVVPALMQRDGIHPTAAAQPQLLDNVWPALEPIIDTLENSFAASSLSELP